MKLLEQQFIRYLIVGTFNTVFTYIIYIGLLTFISYPFAYTITYIIGIAVSYCLNSFFVFNQALSLKKSLQFPIVYAAQYLLGLILLFILIGQLGINKIYAPIVVIFISIPLTYLLSGYILKNDAKEETA